MQIKRLRETVVGQASVDHNLKMIVLDGKMCNFMTNTASSQVRNICNLKPSLMNDWQSVQESTPSGDFYQYGIPESLFTQKFALLSA